MAFVVNVLKEDKETRKTVNLQVLINHESPLFVRKFLQKSGLMILTFTDFYSKPETFGPTYIIITYESTKIQIIGDKDIPPNKLCSFFKKLGYAIDEVNLFAAPLNPDEAKKIIDESDLDIETEKGTEVGGETKRKQVEKELYQNNRKVEKCRIVADRVMDKTDELFYEKRIRITEKDIRQIKDRVEELKKVKMGANYEKMQNMLQGMMFRLNDIEDEYYKDLRDNSPALFVGTNVTVDELGKELAMFDAAQQRKLFGGKAPQSKQYYAILGEPLIYMKFLRKDLIIAIKNSLPYLYKIFDFFFVVFLVVMILLGISIVIISLLQAEEYLKVVYTALIHLGIIGGLVYLCSLVNTQKQINIIMLLIGTPIVYFIIIHFIKTTFALY